MMNTWIFTKIFATEHILELLSCHPNLEHLARYLLNYQLIFENYIKSNPNYIQYDKD
jgi:hypothetical protein